MECVHFPEANRRFVAPSDLAESQCQTAVGYVGIISGGSVDGSTVVVVAWKPSLEELNRLIEGAPIFLTCMGGLPPHFLTTDFHNATHPI